MGETVSTLYLLIYFIENFCLSKYYSFVKVVARSLFEATTQLPLHFNVKM